MQRGLQFPVEFIGMRRLIWARMGLVILTIWGLFSLYQVLTDLGILAYPFADPGVGRTKLYVRLTTTILIGVSWSALAFWLSRRSRWLILASYKEMQSLGPEYTEFVRYVIREEAPAIVSDEATAWDISVSTQGELLGRCFIQYGVHLRAEDLKLPLSRLLPELKRRRTK